MDDSSNTTEQTSQAGQMKQTIPIIVLFVLSYTVIFLFSIIGNTLVCLVIVKTPRMQNVTNYFILNLAVADLLVAVFCMPFTLVDNIVYGWPFGDVMCKLSPATTVISVAASVFTLVAIAVDRYCAVLYPTQETITVRRMAQSIVVIWFLAILIATPVIFVRTETTADGTTAICTEEWPTYGSWNFQKMFSLALLISTFVAPLMIITILYLRIGYRIWFRRAPGDGTNVSDQARASALKKKVKVIKMLIVVVVVFALSWLPIQTLILVDEYVIMTYTNFSAQNAIYKYCFPVAHWLSYFNSCVNPIIYGYFNQNFRAGFKAILIRSALGRAATVSRL